MTTYPVPRSKRSRLIPLTLCLLSVIPFVGNFAAYRDLGKWWHGFSAVLWGIGCVVWLGVTIRRTVSRDTIQEEEGSLWFCRSVGSHEIVKEPILTVTEDSHEFILSAGKGEFPLSKGRISEELHKVLERQVKEE